MAGNLYLTVLNGIKTLVAALQTSAGAGDAGKLVALDSTGKISDTMMPVGIGAGNGGYHCVLKRWPPETG